MIRKEVYKGFDLPIENIVNSTVHTPFDKAKMLIEKGVNNPADLSRLSGLDYSFLFNLKKSQRTSIEIEDLIGPSLGSDEIHFYEILSRLISKGILKNITFSNTNKDFVKSLLYNCDLQDFIVGDELGKGFSVVQTFNRINKSEDYIVLNPNVGGYLTIPAELKKKESLSDFSVKQLNLLYKGISQHNTNHPILIEICNTIQKVINKVEKD